LKETCGRPVKGRGQQGKKNVNGVKLREDDLAKKLILEIQKIYKFVKPRSKLFGETPTYNLSFTGIVRVGTV